MNSQCSIPIETCMMLKINNYFSYFEIVNHGLNILSYFYSSHLSLHLFPYYSFSQSNLVSLWEIYDLYNIVNNKQTNDPKTLPNRNSLQCTQLSTMVILESLYLFGNSAMLLIYHLFSVSTS